MDQPFQIHVTHELDESEELDMLCDYIEDIALKLSEIAPNNASEISVLLTDDTGIQEINLEWRGIDAPTDVLSFPALSYPVSFDEQSSSESEEEVVDKPFDDEDLDDEQETEVYEDMPGADDDELLNFAFPHYKDIPSSLGDIVINIEYAKRIVENKKHRDRIEETLEEVQANTSKTTNFDGVKALLDHWDFKTELAFLTIHGYLHLLEMDDTSEEEDRLMRHEELKLLASLFASN